MLAGGRYNGRQLMARAMSTRLSPEVVAAAVCTPTQQFMSPSPTAMLPRASKSASLAHILLDHLHTTGPRSTVVGEA